MDFVLTTGGQYKTHEYFQTQFTELANGEYTLLNHYISVKEKIEVKLNICGNEYKVSPSHS